MERPKEFPDWIYNALIIGKNLDNEFLAVGMNKGVYEDNPYLYRLAHGNDCWVTIRVAIKEDLDKYDFLFLKSLAISLVGDNRT